MDTGQESLHSGYGIPSSFVLSDITALLPCEENDFSFARIPSERAALDGTMPALSNPNLCKTPARSLFAVLIQVQNLWSRVARHTNSNSADADKKPWDPESYYHKLSIALQEFEETLSSRYRWSIWNLRGYKVEGLHLVGENLNSLDTSLFEKAYMSMVMILKLCKIVSRRWYLRECVFLLLTYNCARTDV
jgi:hypothetical protein